MKYILNKTIFTFLFGIIISLGFCQNEILNFQKYWYYKTRLNNDFIKVGKEHGESIPFNQRGDGQKDYPTNNPNNIATGLRAGDGLSSIGQHLAALATEYGLLKQNNQNTDSVKHEIFCCLNALNRIDNYTEQWLDGGTTIALNGFMMRDDIGEDFLMKNYEHFNYYNQGKYATTTDEGFYPNNYVTNNGFDDKGFCTQIPRGQKDMISTFKEIQNGSNPRKNRLMSQDHVITLLIGLSLVNKYVDYSANDNGATFPYENQSVSSLKQEAWNIADRIAQHFKNDPFWRLIDPVNQNMVEIGGSTAFTQYGLAEALCRAVNYNTNLPSPFIPLVNPFGSLSPFTCNFNTVYVQSVGFASWRAFLGTPPTSVDNQGFKVHLLATGNCGWEPGTTNVAGQACNWVSSTICTALPWPLNQLCETVTSLVCSPINIQTSCYYNRTQDIINFHALQLYSPAEQLKENVPRKYDFWHAPLLHKVLYPSSNTNYIAYLPPIKGALDNAPCEGPYNFGQFARPQFEWTSENRLEKMINRQDHNEPDKGWYAYLDDYLSDEYKIHTKNIFKGESNGIDYMVMHNLYRLTASGISTSYYQNLSHRYINITLPIMPNQCVKPTTCLFRAFETITADNTINNNGDVDYKAGKVIVLKPGFNAVSGANFHAYIERANCSNGSSGLRTANTDSTKSPETTFYGYDEMNDNTVTHYVDYSNVKDSVREDFMNYLNPIKLNDVLQQQPIILNENNYSDKADYFNVYPNPANEYSTVEFSLAENENAELVILNNMSQVIASDYAINQRKYLKTFHTAGFAKGLYLIKIKTNTDRILIKKLTIQ